MKKMFRGIDMKFSFFTLILMSSTMGYSQSEIQYGITTGLNIPRFTNGFNAENGNYFNISSKGFKFGVFAEIPLNDKVLFSPKLIFNQLGDREKDFGDVEERGLDISTIDYKLDFMSIPLNIRFFKKFYIELGPQIGILISEKSESLDLGSVENSFEIGSNIEIGYKIEKFRISLNFYQGFSNLLEIEKNPPIVNNDLNVRNFSFSFNFCYVVFN